MTTTMRAQTGWAAIKHTWAQPGRWIGLAVSAAPSIVFLAANAIWDLTIGIVAAGLTAGAGAVFRLIRREGIRSSVVGMLVVAVCAAIAAMTGQARGFFLLPTLVPFAVIGVCLVTMLIGRPLTGLLLNRATGGPPDWHRNRGLRRVHMTATSTAIAINAVNATLQAVFYTRNNVVVLAVAHVATGPVFATLVAMTIVAVRKTLATQR